MSQWGEGVDAETDEITSKYQELRCKAEEVRLMQANDIYVPINIFHRAGCVDP